MVVRQKYQLRFFFDYGAGGCLWAGDNLTMEAFGLGPIDEEIANKTGKLSAELLREIEKLDERHADYLNKDYPPDPSLWRQSDCNDFNEKVDSLLSNLTQQLSTDFEIEDRQIRYSEDEDLERYLLDPKQLKRLNK